MWDFDASQVANDFSAIAAGLEFCSLRLVRERHEALAVRRNVVQPVRRSEDSGAMLTVFDGGGWGYAATPDLSPAGLSAALTHARDWARASAGRGLLEFAPASRSAHRGEYGASIQKPWSATTLDAKLELLRQVCAELKRGDPIIDWQASLWHTARDTLYLASDGVHIRQHGEILLPSLVATAHRTGETQTRTLGGDAYYRQGGLEILDDIGYAAAAPRIAEQALELLGAPNCPSASCDVVLAPDQMALQIHESIGHPLELDRILGDERNYAGTSFVTLDMFGVYRYGSPLLNVTFDPAVAGEVASYAFDDEGSRAEREYLIKAGILVRPLGGRLSQRRAALPGVANTRASGWNRPPIDRMANLNLEPGAASFADLIGNVERGVYMETNRSWSIDDSRNKFQFGCEWARLIDNGELKGVVKNPNYRGISAEFWRNLVGVGGPDTLQVVAAAYCGKGEPNQAVAVGHTAPPCLFRQVAVFGGA